MNTKPQQPAPPPDRHEASREASHLSQLCSVGPYQYQPSPEAAEQWKGIDPDQFLAEVRGTEPTRGETVGVLEQFRPLICDPDKEPTPEPQGSAVEWVEKRLVQLYHSHGEECDALPDAAALELARRCDAAEAKIARLSEPNQPNGNWNV